MGAGFGGDVAQLDFFPAVDAGGFEEDFEISLVAELAGSLESDGLGLTGIVVAGKLIFVAHFARAVGFGDFAVVDLDIEEFFVIFKMVEADGGADDAGDNDDSDKYFAKNFVHIVSFILQL